jgi:hypothetical protein
MRDAGLPVTLIVVGLIWLVWYFGWIPDVDWIIAVGLVAGGIAVLAALVWLALRKRHPA